MQTIHSITTLVYCNSLSFNLSLEIKNLKHHQGFSSPSKISPYEIPSSTFYSLSSHGSGLCKASEVAELFPTTSLEIVVRKAKIKDCWEVAETYCSSFFPEYFFPLDFVLRFDRLVGMLFGFSIPKGCKRTCLVAVIGSSSEDSFFLGVMTLKLEVLRGKFSLNKGYVGGILTVDTVADFIPRKGLFNREELYPYKYVVFVDRTGIAYISNVAVREKFRRKGIAKRLIAKAESTAKTWGCRAIALHCDLNNPGATRLYTSQGFKFIKVPEGANWPQPRTSSDVQFGFMMKLLGSTTSSPSI